VALGLLTSSWPVTGSAFVNSFGRPFGGVYYSGPFSTLPRRGSPTAPSRKPVRRGHRGAIGNTGTMVIRNCTFEDSHAFRAGAIYNEGTLSVFATTISGRFARIGGGVYNKGELVLTNSAVTDNGAIVAGGGICTSCGGRTTLIRTSVTGNTLDKEVRAYSPIPADRLAIRSD
jgi:hypothetical protein